MSDTGSIALVGVLAALCGATATAMLVHLGLYAWRRRSPASGPAERASVCRWHLPWPLRLLRAAVAPVARRFDTTLRALPIAPLERLLRRAGVADELSCSEAMLLWLPPVALSLPVLLLDASAGGLLLLVASLIAVLALRWLHARAVARERQVLRELPFHLDMLALALESGAPLLLALRSCTPRSPPGPLREALDALAADLQAGRLRHDALAALQRRVDFDSVTALTTAVREAERSGAGLARVLRIQADQRRHERFHRAEKLAMQAPVRMLGPLVLCIFPCTFIVIGFVLYVRVAG